MKQRLLAFLMMIFLLTSSSVVYAAGDDPAPRTGEPIGVSFAEVNPVYESEIELEQVIENPRFYAASTSEANYTSDESKIIAEFREKMIARETTIVFYYRTSAYENTQDWLRTLIRRWFEEACVETDNPRGGDFLRYSVSAYGVSTDGFHSGSDTCLQITMTMRYYSSKSQEAVLSQRIDEVLQQLNIQNLSSEYEKATAIYKYICENVTYDYENLYDEDYLLKFSAYAAMVNKTAVCQGYATLFYAMAEQAGLDARVITGKSSGVNHAWNIVKIGDYYYYLDSTWDAGKSEYSYYLKCEENFTGHDIGEKFLTDEFRKQYPIAKLDFNPCVNHVETADPPVQPTCTTNGLTAGSHCSICGAAIVPQKVIPFNGHKTEVDQAVAASCERDGLTEGSHCSVCGTVIVAQKPVAKTGHKYEKQVLDGSLTVYKYVCRYCADYYSEVIDGYRLYGSSRYYTSLAIADALKADMDIQKYGSIVVAGGAGFPDALAGSYLANVLGAPIFMANPSGANVDELTAYVKENMSAEGVVYILGGTGAVPKTFESALRKQGYQVKRLSGKSRYETNIKILEEAVEKGGDMSQLFVCTGNSFADSLSASVTGLPILLVDNKTGKLTAEQKTFLDSQNATIHTCYVIGGTGAVPESLKNQMSKYGSVTRIKGKDRYATSVAIAKKFMPDAEVVIIASGQNFPDGLCGGPLGYNLKAPLILTYSGSEAEACAYVKENAIEIGIILGGQSAISKGTERKIFGEELAEKKYEP